MATLTRHHGGWLIQYRDGKKRRSFYPGKMTKQHAETFRRQLETLLSARTQGTYAGDECAAWLNRQDADTRAKLFQHGLIEQPKEVAAAATERMRLKAFTDSYISGTTAKDSTKIVWRRCQKLLVTHFGADRLLASIELGDVKDWRQFLLTSGKTLGGIAGLSENTVRKMCSVAAQFFTDAVDRKLVKENPFTHKSIPRTTQENRTRDEFISREIADKVLEACPDAEWRLLFALSRYGGLRCPSEHLSLRWRDVLWDKGRLVITSPKTARYEGKGRRIIPIFPELKPYLTEAWDAAEEGAEFCITRYRSTNANLRTQLERIIVGAGLTPWPKLFHNLRASRETELADEYPIQTVVAWIGNSPRVAIQHYLTVPDEHFARAALVPDSGCNASCNAASEGTGGKDSEHPDPATC